MNSAVAQSLRSAARGPARFTPKSPITLIAGTKRDRSTRHFLLGAVALGTVAVASARVVDVPGNANGTNPATSDLDTLVGARNSGRLLGNFTVFWGADHGSFTVPVDTNGFVLNADTGSGNRDHVASGPISGTGSLVITNGPHGNGNWDSIYTIAGKTANTYTGGTLINRGQVKLMKRADVDAIPGNITLGSTGNTARLIWGANNQINDLANITVLLPTVADGAAPDANLNYLDLAGCKETISSLTLPDAGEKTQVRPGAGGVLTVTQRLTVNGKVMPPGTYTSQDSAFVVGKGRVVVTDSSVSPLTSPGIVTGVGPDAGGDPANAADTMSVPELETLRKKYATLVKTADGPYLTAVAELERKYIARLAQEQKKAQESGNLDDALAIDAERKAVTAGKGVPVGDDAGSLGVLKQMHATYRAEIAKLEPQRAKNLKLLRGEFIVELDALVVRLTKDGRLKEAVTVKKFRESLSAVSAGR